MSGDHPGKVKKVFLDLKERGMVEGRLCESESVKNFKGSLFSDKTYFNPEYEFDEDSLYFILLHEQGHEEGPKNSQKYFAFLCVFLGLLYFTKYLFGYSSMMADVFVSIAAVLFTLFSLRVFSTKFHEDEYRADEYAASKFKSIDKFEKEPWEVLEKLIRNYRGQKSSGGIKKVLLKNVLHPSDEKRVENLKGEV